MKKRWRLSTLILVLGAVSTLGACSGVFDEQEIWPGNDVIKRQTIAVDSGKYQLDVSYLTAGDPDGQRVIFVHGTPGQAEGWMRYLRNVTPGYEYVAVDRPGFGATKPNDLVAELDHQAAAIEPFLKTRSGKKPILVGHSLGGPVVAAVAANYPDQVGGIIELAGSVDPAQEEIRWVQYVGAVPPFVWIIPKWLRNTNDEVFALKDELILLGDKLERVTAPVVVIHGTKDDLVPYENVAYMQARFVNARPFELITLEGQNHFLPWNSEKILRNAIDRISDGFPGEPRPHVTIRVEEGGTFPEDFDPPGKVFQGR